MIKAQGRVGYIKVSIGVLALCVTGCVVTPKPIDKETINQRVTSDLEQMFKDQEPVRGEISLYEAMARALKYNLAHRLKMLDQVVKNRELDVSRYDLLPQLAASAGYKHRDNVNASSSFSVSRDTESLETSTSQDQELWNAQARIVWNVLDFGVSYLRQKQQANKVLIAEEQRRKVVQNIVQEVRHAYWRVVAAEQVEAKLKRVMREIEYALNTAKRMQHGALQKPLLTLKYRRDLLKTLRNLMKKKEQLSLAKADLSRLMNVPLGSRYQVAQPPLATNTAVAFSAHQLQKLQLAALSYRPELMEMDYKSRIVKKEGKIAKLDLLPGLSFNLGSYYDDNSFLLNQSWAEAGIQVSYDLMKLARIPDINLLHETRDKLVNMQRQALTSAVLSQVELSLRSYLAAKQDLEYSIWATDIEKQRYRQYQAASTSGVGERLELIQSQGDLLLAKLDQYYQYAEVQSEYGMVLNSLGIDPLPKTMISHDLTTLAKTLQHYFEKDLRQHVSQIVNVEPVLASNTLESPDQNTAPQ
ncbi:TolC family protein [Endozoicomonas sp. SM1973]|uniref:TolC family protein n=1 Tax=Spartinivicinus marinus TaxID=2994442 RepID=A0A853IKH4_9GAMM|nr:TolC family protein [Spartinivicinus marinus]MCX4029336.1 TolC family protein [Spartinivicinus marinus]NYZ68176.1 TolC family protein [Spartinivicinus marinus]